MILPCESSLIIFWLMTVPFALVMCSYMSIDVFLLGSFPATQFVQREGWFGSCRSSAFDGWS